MTSDWRIVCLSEITSGGKGIEIGPFGSAIKAENYCNSGVPYLRGVNLNHPLLEEHDVKFIPESLAKKLRKHTARRRDLLFPHRGTLGQVSIIPESSRFEKYVIGNSMIRARIDENIAIPEFVFLWFLSHEGQWEIDAYTVQVGVPAIAQPKSSYGKMLIKLPSLETQQKIVDTVYPIYTRKRRLDNDLKLIINTVNSFFEAMFVRFHYTKKLINKRAVKDTLTEDSMLTSFVHSDLGMIPVGWEVRNMARDFNFEKGSEPGRDNCNEVGEGDPFIRVGDITGSSQNPLYVENHLGPVVNLGETVTTFDGNPGHSSFLKQGFYSSGIRKVVPNQNYDINGWFPYFLINTHSNQSIIKAYSTGTTILHASTSIDRLLWIYPGEKLLDEFQVLMNPYIEKIINISNILKSLSFLSELLLRELLPKELNILR